MKDFLELLKSPQDAVKYTLNEFSKKNYKFIGIFRS